MLISQDLEKIAAALPTMYIPTPDDQDVMLVPTPASVAKTGIIPEGFSIDLALDPDTVLAAYSTVQFPQEKIESLKAILNGPDNVKIVPTSIYENKRAVTLAALEKIKQDPDLKHLIGGQSPQALQQQIGQITGTGTPPRIPTPSPPPTRPSTPSDDEEEKKKDKSVTLKYSRNNKSTSSKQPGRMIRLYEKSRRFYTRLKRALQSRKELLC
jgi:hypothetical protein